MPIPSILLMFSLCLMLLTGFAPAHSGNAVDGLLFADSTVRSGDIVIRVWKHPRMTVVEIPDTLVFLYLPHNNLPIDSVALRENLRGIVNGSFFDGVRGKASHAGWLSLYGLRVTPIMDDRQLTHVVRISGSVGKIECIPVKTFIPSGDPAVVEFQTGPLVIDSGFVRNDLIKKSINGASRHTRTLLAVLGGSRAFFITVADPESLSEVGELLRRLSIFQEGRLDVVNLDGGSSVALYLRDIPGFDYNARDHLPIMIGFH